MFVGGHGVGFYRMVDFLGDGKGMGLFGVVMW